MTVPPSSNPRKDRFAYLDGMRGWAALLVVLHHGTIATDFALYTGQPAHSRGFWDLRISATPFFPLAAGGSLAVCIFFALSGFVLAHAYSRSQQNWLALAARRFARLGIPMLAGCLFGWLLLVLGLMRNQPAGAFTRSSWLSGQFHQVPDLIAAASEPIVLLLGFGTSFATSYDSSLWTMPIEFGASLILMTIFVLLRYSRKPSNRLAGYAFCVLAVFCIGSFFSLFAFGAALRLLQPQPTLSVLGRSRWGLAAVFGLALFFGTVPFSAERWPIYNWLSALPRHFVWHARLWPQAPEAVWHGFGAALILLAVFACPPIQAALSRPLGRFLGRISFPLYILHVPILMVVECNAILFCQQIGLPPFAGAVLSLSAFVAVSVAVAAGLTPLVEGGAIFLSSRLGSAIDSRTERAATRLTSAATGAK